MRRRLIVCLTVLVALGVLTPVLRASLPASDNFNRADATTLGGNYTSTGLDTVAIHSNHASGTGTTNSTPIPAISFWSADSFNADQYAQVTVSSLGSLNSGGPCVRMVSTNSGTGYLLDLKDGQVYGITGTVFTAIGAAFGAYIVSDVGKLTITGSTLEVFKNGTSLGTRTDATYASGSAGVWIYGSGFEVDDFSAGNMGGAVTAAPRLTLLGVGP